jgi:outer membrane lipopolysaccharide assembly protein LptE/RlpB
MRLAAAVLVTVAAVLVTVGVLAGCGFDVQAADLFQVTRLGQGQKLTLLVNDGGTIACDGRKPKGLPDRLLLQARDLATSLNADVKAKLRFRASARSVFSYTVKVQNGTFTFPDTAAGSRKELAQLELFVVQAAADPCGITA